MKKIITIALTVLIYSGIAIASDLTVESGQQHYKEKEHKIDLQGDVKVKYGDVNVVSPRAEVIINPDKGKVEKIKFDDKAYSYQIKEGKKHEVKAKVLEVSLLNKVLKAEGRTQSTIINGGKPSVIVTSDNQEYDNKTNIIKAQGGVIIYYEDSQAYGEYAQVDLDRHNEIKKILLEGNAYVKKGGTTVKANKFEHYAERKITTATGQVYSDINEEETKIKVWSDFQQIDQKSNIITASGHTIVHYKDFIAKGPKASVYPDKKTNKLNKIVFMGRSQIQQEGRSIEADRINMTIEPKDFKAEGNVRTFIPNVDSGQESL